ncbi:MAG TPA: (d)CMP kinase [Anaerolineales bacterium]|nr:(d)CMP kinase [Anaerolineales bacterium]
MQRYLVVGASGSGKSTLARAIGDRLGLPYIATDPFYWGPDWAIAPSAHVEACLGAALARPAWVLDGNFDDQRERVWARAECIVWLDLPWPVTVGRVIARNVRWALTREPVWSGNTMTWLRAWSGVRHAARSHGLKRRLYPGWLAAVQGAITVRLTEQRSIDDWLCGLSNA